MTNNVDPLKRTEKDPDYGTQNDWEENAITWEDEEE